MIRSRLAPIAALALASLAACAHGGLNRSQEMDTAPRLIGCSGYSPTAERYQQRGFLVEMRVDPAGSVVPGSVHAKTSAVPRPNAAPGAMAQAVEVARSCTFEPGTRAGVPVESRTTLPIRF